MLSIKTAPPRSNREFFSSKVLCLFSLWHCSCTAPQSSGSRDNICHQGLELTRLQFTWTKAAKYSACFPFDIARPHNPVDPEPTLYSDLWNRWKTVAGYWVEWLFSWQWKLSSRQQQHLPRSHGEFFFSAAKHPACFPFDIERLYNLVDRESIPSCDMWLNCPSTLVLYPKV